MPQRLKKSIPFLLAIVFGTLAAALIVGVALYTAHL